MNDMLTKSPKRRLSIAVLALFAVLAFLLAGCFSSGNNPPSVEKPPSDDAKLAAQVEQILRSMSTAEKLGQMVMIGVQGTAVDEDSKFMLRQYHIGGVILFDRNLENAEQVKNFTDGLQEAADRKVPLFIGIDEEGGPVVRMPQIVPAPPSARQIG